MGGVYNILVLILLTLLSARIVITKFRQKGISSLGHLELFFFICLANQIWGAIDYKNVYFFYFFHCAMPIVLSLSIVSEKVKYGYLFFQFLLVLLNLYFHDVIFIVSTYFITMFLVMRQLVYFALNSKRNREKVPLYSAILGVIFLTQLIYLMNSAKVDWHGAQLVACFLYLTQFVYLSTIILGHVYLRRFIVN